MNAMNTMLDGDLEERAQSVLHGVRDFGIDTLVPASTDRLHDLAGRVHPDRYRKQVRELEHDFTKRVGRLERKLERKVKNLPVDTPLDRRRRHRVRRRGAAGIVAILGIGGAIAYAWWRSRRASERGIGDDWLEKRGDNGAPGDNGSPARDEATAAAGSRTSS
jgi:hypothetical protein